MKSRASLSLYDPVRFTKGVGPRKAEVLSGLGIKTVYDLLNHFPFRIDDFSRFVPIDLIQPGEDVTVAGKVLSSAFAGSQRGQALRVRISDGRGTLSLVWYNMPYMQANFQPGKEVLASGRAEWRRGGLEMAHPVWQVRSPGGGEPKGPIIPVYHSAAGLTSAAISKIVRQALPDFLPLITNSVPEEILRKLNYPDERQAYQDIHDPPSAEAWNAAMRTLAFREMLYLQIALLLMREESRKAPGPGVFSDFELPDTFIDLLPFKLTPAQERAIGAIRADLCMKHPMNRLLQGDVGSGKTVIAIYTLLAGVANGYQGALLAPTEILAEQHRKTFEKLCQNVIRIGFLTGSSKLSDKRQTLDMLASGELDVVIGTHALLEPSIKWNNLGVVVTDEQHRFGVRQRLSLSGDAGNNRAGICPHVLVMSATPIPRSLALTMYGDLDVSVIDTMPPGRMPVSTVVVGTRARRQAYQKVRDEVSEGRQAYVVCPLIKEGASGRKAAEAVASELSKGYLQGLSIGLIHGDMPRKELAEGMNAFLKGDVSVLVSTTVIEVGIDVPNASVMVVEDADSFGLATLHQLRGRIGRGKDRSYCYLVASAGTEAGQERLRAMETLQDGFAVAEADLEQRGPGQFFGMAQHGLPEIRISHLQLTLGVISSARDEAKSVLSAIDGPNPTPALANLVSSVKEHFGDLFAHSRSR